VAGTSTNTIAFVGGIIVLGRHGCSSERTKRLLMIEQSLIRAFQQGVISVNFFVVLETFHYKIYNIIFKKKGFVD